LYKYLRKSNKKLYWVLSEQPLWLSSKSLWLYTNNIATIFLVIHPLSSRSVSLEGILFSPQYFCIFFYIGHAGLLSFYTFYGPTTCTTCSLFPFCLFTSIFGHSYLQCPTPQYLKHFTSSTLFCCFTSTLSLTLYCITLVTNISYLFWDFSLFSFSSSFLVLQL